MIYVSIVCAVVGAWKAARSVCQTDISQQCRISEEVMLPKIAGGYIGWISQSKWRRGCLIPRGRDGFAHQKVQQELCFFKDNFACLLSPTKNTMRLT
jgi:hypothetical protein